MCNKLGRLFQSKEAAVEALFALIQFLGGSWIFWCVMAVLSVGCRFVIYSLQGLR